MFRDLVTKEAHRYGHHDPNSDELADHVYTLEDGEIVEEI